MAVIGEPKSLIEQRLWSAHCGGQSDRPGPLDGHGPLLRFQGLQCRCLARWCTAQQHAQQLYEPRRSALTLVLMQ